MLEVRQEMREAERSWRRRWRWMGRWREVLPVPELLLQGGGPGQLLGHLEPQPPSASPPKSPGVSRGDDAPPLTPTALHAGGFASTSRSPSARQCSALTGTPTMSSWPLAPATSSAGEEQEGWMTGGA